MKKLAYTLSLIFVGCSILCAQDMYLKVIGRQGTASTDVSLDVVAEVMQEIYENPAEVVRAFCQHWMQEEYDGMYALMDADYINQVSSKKFQQYFKSDKEWNGGIAGFFVKEAGQRGDKIQFQIELIYRNTQIHPKEVMASVVKSGRGYKLVDSGIIPLDLNEL